MKRIIVSADDFGRANEINEAVERAHRHGILSSASLMVNGPAALDAIERARRLPNLAVGLHVVVVHGRPILPPESVPDLVDAGGCFPTDLFSAGVRYVFSRRAREQLQAEIRAQFQAFARTSLPLDHVNAQSHLHVHPTIFGMLLRIGREYGMRAVRLPYEPFEFSYAAGRDRGGARLGTAAVTAPWIAAMRRRARALGIVTNDYAFGVNDAGAMTSDRLLRAIAALRNGVTEIFFHPATGPFEDADAGTENYRWRAELDALTDPRVRDALEAAGIERTTYGNLSA